VVETVVVAEGRADEALVAAAVGLAGHPDGVRNQPPAGVALAVGAQPVNADSRGPRSKIGMSSRASPMSQRMPRRNRFPLIEGATGSPGQGRTHLPDKRVTGGSR
jgi:hypothetical protein